MNKLNSRQKLVLINALKGMNQTDSYEAVYGHSSATYRCASELFNKPHFKTALENLQNKALVEVQAQVLSKDEKRNILAGIARAQLADLLDDDGNIKLDKKNPSMKALKEWYHRERTDRNGNPIITKSAKLIDAIAAIQEDNKMMGHYAPSKHLVGHAQLDVVFVEDRKEDDNTSSTERD